MEDTTLMQTQTVKIDADPAGDLVLVIGSGDNQKSIRASSKVLSLASPVLAAMFSPHRFLEGTALSTSNPPSISLPDDEPEAVTMFCHLVHFEGYHGEQPSPSFDQLVNLALFCDKYDAGLALNPWSELWAFDNHESFWISSRSMKQYDTAEVRDGTKDELFPLVPHGLYGKQDT